MTNDTPLYSRHKLPIWGWILLAAVAIFAGGLAVLGVYARPILHDRAVIMLQSRFHGDVQIGEFSVSLFPAFVKGTGVVVRSHGRTDVPPLVEIREFSASASLLGLFEKPVHLQGVRLKGLLIHFPPNDKREPMMNWKGKDLPVLIDVLSSEDGELDMLPANPDKPVHQFLIHQLTMHHLGGDHAAPFEAVLTNPAPPGEIHVKGDFGPWQADEPRTTPVAASYTFDNADLNHFKGIGGILSSRGKFGGPLENLQVSGETTTPDFSVDSGGHPMMLKTEFQATVDGTNGDTLLHPVIAHLGGSTLVCNGAVVKPKSGRGKEVLLEVVGQNARIQDLVWLAVKGDKPVMTGSVNLKTRFDLPSASENGGKVVERLKLDGQFGIGAMMFTDPGVRGKVESLSDRAQGRPKDTNEDDPLSQLKGRFALNAGILDFRRLSFSVAGADIQLEGTYGLRSEALDFHGKARLQAKPSQMTTGFKSVLLKPFDHFFRKDGATQIPIKVTGNRSHPDFGLDLHHKKEEEAKQRSEDQKKENQAREQGKKNGKEQDR
jgi:hypothetical protein